MKAMSRYARRTNTRVDISFLTTVAMLRSVFPRGRYRLMEIVAMSKSCIGKLAVIGGIGMYNLNRLSSLYDMSLVPKTLNSMDTFTWTLTFLGAQMSSNP